VPTIFLPTDDTQKIIITAGDRLRLPTAVLKDDQGNPYNLAGLALTFRLVDARTGDVAVDSRPAVSLQTDSNAATWGKCCYVWGPNETDTPGLYRAYFVAAAGGLSTHFPPDGDYLILIQPEAP
jgi:hypothetical protein